MIVLRCAVHRLFVFVEKLSGLRFNIDDELLAGVAFGFEVRELDAVEDGESTEDRVGILIPGEEPASELCRRAYKRERRDSLGETERLRFPRCVTDALENAKRAAGLL